MKERVTLTIEQNLLRQIDSTVDGNTIRNRSHAVELLLREAMQGSMPTQAIILAGGNAKAVQNILQPIDEKPLILHNLELLMNAGIEHIIIISTQPDEIKEVVGEINQANIQYINETHSLGTAGSLHLAEPYIKSSFIVTNADDSKDINIKAMFDFHQQTNGRCTIALTSTDNPSKYGVALLNGTNIVTFVEKPSKETAPSNLISAGFYIMEPEVFESIPTGYGRMEYDLFPKLAREHQLHGYPFSGTYKHYGPTN